MHFFIKEGVMVALFDMRTFAVNGWLQLDGSFSVFVSFLAGANYH